MCIHFLAPSVYLDIYIYIKHIPTPPSYRVRGLRIGQNLPLGPCHCSYQRPKGEVQLKFLVDKFVQINSEFTNIMKELDASITTLQM